MFRVLASQPISITIKKSEFIGVLFRVTTEDEVRAHLKELNRSHPKATHICSAYILGDQQEVQRSNDDGEPSGTAGLPMLEVLRKRNMEHILVCVIRYYGGIQLGAGGLNRAYSSVVSETLNQATLSQLKPVVRSTAQFPIHFADRLIQLLSKSTDIVSKSFEDVATVVMISDDTSWLDACLTLSAGQFTVIDQSFEEIEVPIL